MFRSIGFGPIITHGLPGILLLSTLAAAQAADLDKAGPPASVAFGTLVFALPNGNIVAP